MTTTASHPPAAAAGGPGMTAPQPTAVLRDGITAARADAGRLLACYRHAAGLSQVRLARQIRYSATVVAHAEQGRRPVSAEFWELADEALGASGNLTTWGTRIKDLATAMREEQRRLDMASHAQHLAGHSPPPGARGTTTAAQAVPEPASTTPADGRCPHCRQPVTPMTQTTALPDIGAPGTRKKPDQG